MSTLFNGSGTKQDPYLIEDVQGLYNINDGNYLGGGYHFKQTVDLDLSDFANWIPLGEDKNNPFKGNYDGNGKIIKNTKVSDTVYGGLFGYVVESNISDLRVEDIEISGDSHSGGIAGYMEGGSIEGCASSVNISSSTTCSAYSRGIVAYMKGGSIEGCYSSVNISSSITSNSSYSRFSYSGGIAGYMKGGSIEGCWSSSDISSSPSKVRSLGRRFGKRRSPSSCSGGIVAYMEGGSIEGCYSSSNISSSSYSGGIVGYMEGSSIENSLALNTSIKGSHVFRIGLGDTTSTSLKNYALTNTLLNNKSLSSSDASSINGKDLIPALINQRFFENTLKWDFKKIWEWNSSSNLPILRQRDMRSFDAAVVVDPTKLLDNMFSNNIWI